MLDIKLKFIKQIKKRIKKKITKRDVLCFIIGILTYFAIDTIIDWDSNKKAFIDGYNKGMGIESAE